MSILGTLGGVLTRVPQIFTFVLGAIDIVEKVAGYFKGEGDTLPSDQKHAMAAALVREALVLAEGFSSTDIVDEEMFEEGLNATIPGVVKMLNASVWYKRD